MFSEQYSSYIRYDEQYEAWVSQQFQSRNENHKLLNDAALQERVDHAHSLQRLISEIYRFKKQ